MIKQFESLDSIVTNNDIQYLEHRGILRRENSSESSGHIRSDEVYGRFQLPEVGKVFNLVAEPFDKNLSNTEAMRIVHTSLVQRVEKNEYGIINFWTLNSKYSITLT